MTECMCEPHASGSNRCLLCRSELARQYAQPARLVINAGLPSETTIECAPPHETAEGEL